MRNLKLVFLLLIITGLVACGGGESGSGDEFAVLSIKPANNSTDVNIDTNVEVTFTHEVQIESVSSESFKLQDSDGLDIDGEILIDKTIATFKPVTPLANNTSYSAKISRDVTSTANNKLSSNFSYSFKTKATSDTEAPFVASTFPDNGYQGFKLNNSITITFNEPVKPASLSGISFSEIDPVTNVEIAKVSYLVSYTHGNTVTLIPNGGELEKNASFEILLSGIKDEAGNVLPDYGWKFTTGDESDSLLPEVNQTMPAEDAVDFPVTRDITIFFSKSMDSNSITNTQFTVTEVVTGNQLNGTVSYVNENNKAVFSVNDSNGLLKNNTEYEVSISDVRDLAGNIMEAHTWRFTTASAEQTPPEVVSVEFQQANNGSGIAPDSNIVITFSESLLPSSINNESVKINNEIAGTVSMLDTNKVVFVPATLLSEKTIYTLVIDTSVQDESLNGMVDIYSQSFTTGDLTSPIVQKLQSRDSAEFPPNNSIDQATNTTVSVTFNEPILATADDVYMKVSTSSGPVSGVVTVSDSEIKFTTDADFPQNNLILVQVTTDVKDLVGNELAETYEWSFTTGDTSAPEPVSYTPEIDQTRVALDTNIIVTFGENELISITSVTDTTFVLRNLNTNEQVEAAISVSNNQIVLNPISDLPEKTSFRVEVSGDITDMANHKINAPLSWIFTTDDLTAPTISDTSPNTNAENVAVAKQITIDFLEAIKAETINTASVYLKNNADQVVPASVELLEEGMRIRLIPLSILSEQSSYYVNLTSAITDLFDNPLMAYNFEFTTGDFTAPTVVINSETPLNNATNVVLTQSISVQFSEAMDPTTTEAAISIPGVSGTSVVTGNTLVFTPSGNLTEQTQYTVTLAAAAQDVNSNAMGKDYNWSFTTGDFTSPTISSKTPDAGTVNVAADSIITVVFDEAMDAITTADAFSISLGVTGATSVIGDTLTFTPDAELTEQAEYTVTIAASAQDDSVNANTLAAPVSWSFTVGDFTAPTVVTGSETPAINATNVVVDQSISVQFSEAMDPTTTEAAFSIPGVSGTSVVTGNTLVFTPSGNLAEKTQYTATLAATAQDVNSNAMGAAFNWIFTTGDFTAPSINSKTPNAGTVNVATDSTITVVFDEAMDPTTTAGAFRISPVVPGTSTVVGDTLTFTPDVAMDEKKEYTITITTGAHDNSVNTNTLSSPVSWSFTIGDFTTPNMLSHSPVGNSVGQNSTVTVIFDEAIDPLSVTNESFIVDDINGAIVGVHTVAGNSIIFTPNDIFASQADYTVTLTTGITDLAGNALAAEIVWSFTTGDYLGPQVNSVIPQNGAINITTNQNITVAFSEAMDKVSTESAFTISPPISGSVLASGNALTFTPTEPYDEQKEYSVIIRGSAKDASQNAMSSDYQWSFTVGDFTAPTVVTGTETPAINATNVAIDQSISVQFSEAMDPTTTEAAFSIPGVSGTSVVTGNTLVFTPNVDMLEKTQYTATLAATAQDVNSNAMGAAYNWSFTTGDFTAPGINSKTPDTGAVNVATDSKITVVFDEAMDPTTTASAFSISLGVTGTTTVVGDTLTFTPDAVLAERAEYTVTIAASAQDANANTLSAPVSWSFTVGDFTAPTVVTGSETPAINATNVAVDQSISVQFSEAMDPTTTETAFSIPGVSGTSVVTGNTLVFTPDVNMLEQTQYTATLAATAQDINGNAMGADYNWSFTTGDFTAPGINSKTPDAGAVSVSTGSAITVVFDEAMDPTTTASAFSISSGVTGTTSIVGNTLTFTPDAVLTEQNEYSVTIAASAQDNSVNANTLAAPVTWSFTVGDFTAPTVVIGSETPAINATNVAVDQSISVQFSEAMDPTTTEAAFSIPNVTGTSVVTGNTLVFTPDVNMAEQTQYTITLAAAAQDVNSNAMGTDYSWSFTTGDFTSPTISSKTPDAGAVNVATDSTITVVFDEAMEPTTTTNAFSISLGVTGTTAVVGDTLTFTPDAALAEQAEYTVTIAASAQDDSVNANTLAAPVSWSFTVGDFTAPTVDVISPVDAAGDIAVEANITATFSEAMNQATVTTSSFTLSDGSTPVIGAISWIDNTATFAPASALTENTTYTATITTAVTDANGVPLVSDKVWSFTTLATAPTVDVISPLDGANDIALATNIEATFSEAMNQDTVTTSSFTLTDGSTAVTGTISWTNNTATFAPASALTENTTYTATITTAATDANGVPLVSDKVWSFTTLATAPTVDLVSPLQDANNVVVNAKIEATFSEAMDDTTVTTSAFNIKDGSTPVAGSISWLGNKAIFTPDNDLIEKRTYTATITTTVTDANGVPLASDKVWNFTIGDFTAPNITATSPLGGGVNATSTTAITVTFNEAIALTGLNGSELSISVEGNTSNPGVPVLTGTDTLSYTVALKDNARYSISFNGQVSDASNNLADYTTTPYEWTFATSSLSTSTADVNGQILLNETIVASSEAFYVVTGLIANQDYIIKLDELLSGTGLNLEIYSDAFINLSCLSNSGLASELCIANANATGEIYLKVSNAVSDPSFNLALKTATNTGGSVVDQTYDYSTETTLLLGKDYDINLSSTEDLDLYAFSGSPLTAECRSVTASISESCPVAGGSDITILVDGAKATSSPVNYTINPAEIIMPSATYNFVSPTITASPSPVLTTATENFLVTGLDPNTTYRIEVNNLVSANVDLRVFSDALITQTCAETTPATATELCYSSPQAAGELYLEITGAVSDTINITIDEVNSNSGLVIFDSATQLAAGSKYYYEFTGLNTANIYIVDLLTSDGSTDVIDDDFDLYVYSDQFSALDCSSVVADTGTESCVTSGGVSNIYVIVDTLNSVGASNISISFTAN